MKVIRPFVLSEQIQRRYAWEGQPEVCTTIKVVKDPGAEVTTQSQGQCAVLSSAFPLGIQHPGRHNWNAKNNVLGSNQRKVPRSLLSLHAEVNFLL